MGASSKIRKQIGGKQYLLSRSRGLGAADPWDELLGKPVSPIRFLHAGFTCQLDAPKRLDIKEWVVGAWQAIEALGCSTKSWGSVLDVILRAQALASLGTPKGNIEATQVDSGSARHLLLGKRKPQMLPFVNRERVSLHQ